ncbi:GNAT family N-acetyltransferase [Sphingomonas sp. HMWF008]|nr:GNAT family N-acetyltransferase [Sphingomonas sp. HMWF008]
MRPQCVDDAEALHEAYRDVELMRWWSSGPHADVAETRAYLIPRLDLPSWRGWSITVKGSDRAIGTLAAGERRPGVAEIGYLLVRSAWGQGYAREAVSRLLDRLFADEGYRRVFADTDPDNAPSNALLESLGFTMEGRLRAEWETHIGVRDTLLWGLLADEWTTK